MRQKRRSYRDLDDDEDVRNDDLATVNERLDDLTRQLARMAQANMPPRANAPAPAADPAPSDRVAEALARLDRRLDQVIAEGRAASSNVQRRADYAPPAAPSPMSMPMPAAMPAPAPVAPSRGPANWAAQISARQRALDGGPATTPHHQPMPPHHQAPQYHQTPPPMPPANWAPAPDLTGLEHQLRQINTQISSLHQPYEQALHALRGDLAEIGRVLNEAMPRRAIETLEGEVRALAERLSHSKQSGADGVALGTLEHELAEVRQALKNLTPAESLAGFEEAVRGLYHKIDQIAAAGGHGGHQDPMAFKQLEQAVVSLRGVVSNVASDGALAQLAAEVRGLAAQFERAAADSSSEALSRLDSKITALMESGRTVPPELEGSIRALSERLDRAQLSQGDQLALEALEDRIAKLSEKLDASDSRLKHLDAIERGLADLLVYLEEMRRGGASGLRAPTPPEPTPMPAAPPPSAPAAPAAAPVHAQSPLDLIAEMPAPAPAPVMPAAQPTPVAMVQPPPVPQPALPMAFAPPPPAPESRPRPPARPMPRGPERQPIDPNLPPDTPLEPGSGIPKVKPGSAAARIAASEAALGHVRPAGGETSVKSAAIAAARSAAKAAYLDAPVKVPKSLGPKPGFRLRWPFKKKAKALPVLPPVQAAAPVPPPPPAPAQMPMPAAMPMPADSAAVAPLSAGRRILKIGKTILVAASVAIIVVGTVQTAIELLFPDKPAATPTTDTARPPASSTPKVKPPATTPSRPMPTPEGALPMPPADTGPTGSIGAPGDNASFFDPRTIFPPKAAPRTDVTGSIGRKAAAPHAPIQTGPAPTHAALDGVPTTVSPMLRSALAANNPAAEYELGMRYAEGRGVARNMPEAAQWFERAANAGFAPAQFRLASLNEKGDGVAKNVKEARRLYIAAAAKGHAKAMHNLAVLYAEGIDGKPDYRTAVEWFRKAATYGVTDSQYNLAVLYARGVGIPANLAESYRWFAIAAASGDPDAARKRDEVAARLDKQTLAAAKLAVQSFVPEREPDEATNLKAPPGGWDHTPAEPAKPLRHIPTR